MKGNKILNFFVDKWGRIILTIFQKLVKAKFKIISN